MGDGGAASGPQLVRCTTTVGPVEIIVRPDWAPLGAAHFLRLVENGFFDMNL